MSTQPQTMSSTRLTATRTSTAALLWDHQDSVPLGKILSEGDLVLLLTPAVVPVNPTSAETSDPFEPLGQALARVHPWIRHVPYVKDRGITGVHVAFIKRAKTVIFILTGFSSTEGAYQLELADVVREVCEDRPLIIVACCKLPGQEVQEFGFQTILQSPGYSATDLEMVAALLTKKQQGSTGSTFTPISSLPPRQAWAIHPWDYEQDLAEVHTLWQACLPAQFHLSRSTLGPLLKRDGYAMHHVVRNPSDGSVVGFCATFTTFADSSGDRLIGSIAVLLVQENFRGQGIGRTLHNDSFGKLSKIRGVGRIQVGSTFPRLLYGLPVPVSNAKWFQNRGWKLDEPSPGRGRPVSDWFLRFADSPIPTLASAGMTFRACQIGDAQQVIDMASRESERKLCFGWYDQYAKTVDSSHINDIIVGFEGENLAAAAITYIPNSMSPCATDIPWAVAIGQQIGGVSCICIKDDDPDMANRRDSVTTRLLQSCRQLLSGKGMVGMFVDGIRSDENAFVSLGFRKWADYKDVWRKV
ncbi:hypothetical protein AK830_g11376 [Neonectria ditissima]|uniref:N-acetyltransferase domain-containing protein n=1 Tax=Neonectria ditissima TaxID=78410 RepID=A0A0P7B569_9HYPO|nr:hypothetical protein AK830_g11376 [Neonectria ditissima]